MASTARRGWGAGGGRGASSWFVCGVGATARSSAQTAAAALGGLGSASGGKSGAWSITNSPSLDRRPMLTLATCYACSIAKSSDFRVFPRAAACPRGAQEPPPGRRLAATRATLRAALQDSCQDGRSKESGVSGRARPEFATPANLLAKVRVLKFGLRV